MKARTLTTSSLEIRANRLDLLSRLADDLAHELKNPLHAMVVNLALLRRRTAAGEVEGALDRVAVLEEEVGRIHWLVDSLLHLLRHDPEPARPLEVAAAIHELLPLIELQGKLARIKVAFEQAGDGATVLIRRAAFEHAVLNLVVNALEAMRPAGGRLVLRLDRAAGEVRLRVLDTGRGIPAEDAERLGARGFSTRDGRAGLGLAVARALVEEAGGRLERETPGAAGFATTFLLALPPLSGA